MLKLYGETCKFNIECDTKKNLFCKNDACLCDSNSYYDTSLKKCGKMDNKNFQMLIIYFSHLFFLFKKKIL